jgi:hypothetical protein
VRAIFAVPHKDGFFRDLVPFVALCRHLLTSASPGVIASLVGLIEGAVIRHFVGISLSLLGVVFLASGLDAQNRGGSFFPPPARTGGHSFNVPAADRFHRFGARVAARGGRVGHHRHIYAYPYGYAAYWPYYHPDSDYDDGGADEPAALSPSPAPAKPAESQKPSESMVVELRGDHLVRLTSTGPVEISGRSSLPEALGSKANSVALPAFYSAPAPALLPDAVLVFRDGHREEVPKYTIVGRTIYLKANYWSTGSWTRKIPIADLDIAATLQVNNERGTKFALPSRPSEIIFRP